MLKYGDIRLTTSCIFWLLERFEVHGERGLCTSLVDQTNTMIVVRLMNQYGNYLAISIERLRNYKFSERSWRYSKLDWQAVNKRIRDEQEALVLNDEKGCKASEPDTRH